MKYKIYKEIERTHRYNPENDEYELIEKPKYFIKRKGTIFGFMHNVGEWCCDMDGTRWCISDRFNSLKQAKSFLRCWHKEEYGLNVPIEVEELKL